MCTLLGQLPKDMDMECQQKRSRDRVRCLDVCVVTSIIVLLAALTAMAAVCVPVLITLQSEVHRLKVHSGNKGEGSTPTTTAYKMQNFALLEAISSRLENSNVQWDSVHYGAGKSVGSNFHFDANQHSLSPRHAGTYFIYLNLNLTCTSYNCSAGLFSVHVGDKLSCQVKLQKESLQESKKCWTVSWLDGKTPLLTYMSVPKEGLQNWKLELVGSNLGMFLVE
ncbi:uncharacterized protein LOC144055315 [Vanacampus margaritifer]